MLMKKLMIVLFLALFVFTGCENEPITYDLCEVILLLNIPAITFLFQCLMTQKYLLQIKKKLSRIITLL